MKKINKEDVFIAILAGGKGERLWPKSRARFPKQYINFLGKKTAIQATFERAKKITSKNIFIITNKDSVLYTRTQLRKFEKRRTVIEPFGRNTAPAVGLATLLAWRENNNSILVVMPSDHLIGDNKKFFNVIDTAVEEAKKREAIITLGIKPTSAESSYGYIGIQKKPSQRSAKQSYEVAKFIEKPPHRSAKRLVSGGRFFWNSGIFIFKSTTMLSMLKRYTPFLYKGLFRLPEIKDRRRFDKALEKLYRRVKKESLDCAILEKSKNIRVIPSNFGWNDIGSFEAIARLAKRDRDNNFVFGNHTGIDTKDSFIFSDTNQFVGTIGVKEMVIVATPDAVLVSTRKGAGEVTRLLGRIKKKKEFLRFL